MSSVLKQPLNPAAAGSPPPTLVAVRGLVKRFNDVVAIDNVSLEIPAGSFFALLGPSGCGKTTLLRILAGFERADGGEILLEGKDLRRRPPERRPFNLVFQQYALFPHMTVRENIAFGPTTRGRGRGRANRKSIDERVSEMLRLVRLESLGDRLPSQISGGQAQRVALARALINEPQMLLLDEPLAALDRNVRHAMREELLRIHQRVGTTFVLVTHDQDEALTMSTHIALMNEGKVEQVAPPETLYRRPASLFAARFVGTATFLDAVCTGSGEGRVAATLAGKSVRPTAMEEIAQGEPVTIVLRPDEATVCDPTSGILAGTIQTKSFLGHYFELTIETAAGLCRAHVTDPLDEGAQVGVRWEPGAGLAYRSEQ